MYRRFSVLFCYYIAHYQLQSQIAPSSTGRAMLCDKWKLLDMCHCHVYDHQIKRIADFGKGVNCKAI